MSRLGSFGARLYRGEVSYDFIAHRKLWYSVSAVLLLISIVSLLVLRLTLGIEFRGGAEFRVKGPEVTQETVRETVSGVVGDEIVVQRVGQDTVRAQTESLESSEVEEVQSALAERFDVSLEDVSTQFIGPSWGGDISAKALRALVFFLLGVVVFLSLYFEWKMAMAAMIALLHDLVITTGLYSLVGFEVTPATVIGFLTILGYSLYDTVVVFDKVRENTAGLAGGSRSTYSGAVNLAVNQTLVRSINTSIIALLPIGAILFAGVVLLGAGPLKDLALALFIGVAVGAYSSIFVAPAVLAGFKEREPAMQALARRVANRTGGVTTAPTATRGRTAAAQEPVDEGEAERVPAGAAAAGRPAARGGGGGGGQRPQRNQPRSQRKGSAKSGKKSGKKRR
ncbi:MAG TPA: protein translocase subunit SecF [Actinomycetes bacterium]|nr:protein translocase subunit SecF [Actinomycetes bacterium]